MIQANKKYRTHSCSDLTRENVDDVVRLAGWVHRIRDHGGVLFVDLRDHYGVTQILADPDSPVFSEIASLRAEYCISIEGIVKLRNPDLVNPKITTGEIEIFIRDISILGRADELPLQIFGDVDYPEETRLKYRFLDLRREKLQKNMRLRSDVIAFLRKRMWEKDFREYQTPIITAPSPEGARDFLVPSRLHPTQFYALPQAPQQFKQLLMIAGFDKYFQIAPCFRDEDPRADRSPTDFYQLDIEMSFVTQQDIFDMVEPIIKAVFNEFGGGHKVDEDWPQIPYRQALDSYGTDKPDLRNPLKLQDVSAYFRDSGFAIFARLLEQEGTEIRAIPAPTGGSRKFCDRMNSFAQQEGLPGMGYIFWRESGGICEAAGPLAKNIGPERSEKIRRALGLNIGDSAFFLGGKPADFRGFAAKVRNVIAHELGLIDAKRFAFAWIVDFPIYQKNAQTGEIEFEHNPFSMPQGGLTSFDGDPLEILGYQYDLCCNGHELLSGAIRNHRPEIMLKAFEIAGYNANEVEARFGGMLRAFRYGAPPHGGCAAGIDRIVMLLADELNIREVMLFPMNQRGEDLMLGAPSVPTSEQLMELGLKLNSSNKPV